MSATVYIRPLEPRDALVSYNWRNNPRIWRFTGSRPDIYITPEMETEWLLNVLKRENEKRFAICLCSNDQYIGNIFLTDIKDNAGQMHLFIGELQYWGGGRALQSIRLILDHAFQVMNLDNVYTVINPRNSSAIALGRRSGFQKSSDYFDQEKGVTLEKMIISKEVYELEKSKIAQ